MQNNDNINAPAQHAPPPPPPPPPQITNEQTQIQQLDDKHKAILHDLTSRPRTLSPESLRICAQTPVMKHKFLAAFSRFSEEQILSVSPYVPISYLRELIPRLELQITATAILTMNPSQLRTTLKCLPADDRTILLENIALMISLNSREEIESVIAFLDPLALAFALTADFNEMFGDQGHDSEYDGEDDNEDDQEDLAGDQDDEDEEPTEENQFVGKIVQAVTAMHADQLKVVIPLLPLERIPEIFVSLSEDEEKSEIVWKRLDVNAKKKLTTSQIATLPSLNSRVTQLPRKISLIKSNLKVATSDVESAISRHRELRIVPNHHELSSKLKDIKSEIESIQKDVRDISSRLKLPLRLLQDGEQRDERNLAAVNEIEESVKEISKNVHSLFSELVSDNGALNVYNRFHASLTEEEQNEGDLQKPSNNGMFELRNSLDEVYENEDLAIVLYEAIKSIGNPDAIGSHYLVSWDEIIKAGFRSADDFSSKGITCLEALEAHIRVLRNKSS